MHLEITMKDYVSLTINEKVLLVEYSKKNPTYKQADLVSYCKKQFQKCVDRTTISKVLKRYKSTDVVLSLQNGRTRNKALKFPDLDRQLCEWFIQFQDRVIMCDTLIIEKARNIAKNLNIKEGDLAFSDGWLSSFKTRHGIKQRKLCGESASVNMDLYNTSLPLLQQKIKEYSLPNIFNFDETSLFYRMRPDKTLASKVMKGQKKNKERITIGLCCNSDGSEMLEPVIIGRHENPRCFKGINIKNIGINYYSNSKAWMTAIIFDKWICNWDLKLRKENNKRKILLLLDNASCHKVNQCLLTNIEVLFLPPNCTSKIQPLDAGIIYSFKRKYKLKFIKWLYEMTIKDDTKCLISLIQAIRYVIQAWNEVDSAVIGNCWRHTKLIDTSMYIESTTEEVIDVAYEENIYSSIITKLNVDTSMSLQEFVWVEEHGQETDIHDIETETTESADTYEEKDDDINETAIPINIREALQGIHVLQSYMEQSSTCFRKEIKNLSDIERIIVREQYKSKRQTSLLEFFN